VAPIRGATDPRSDINIIHIVVEVGPALYVAAGRYLNYFSACAQHQIVYLKGATGSQFAQISFYPQHVPFDALTAGCEGFPVFHGKLDSPKCP
jgi:hypothetical protein